MMGNRPTVLGVALCVKREKHPLGPDIDTPIVFAHIEDGPISEDGKF